MRKVIRLTESDLHRIIKESVRRIIKEGIPDPSDFLRDEPGNKSVDRFGNEIEYDEDGNELYADFWDD